MKQTIFLLTENFPFSRGEEFIENEITYLAGEFNIIIIPMHIPDTSKRQVPPSVVIDSDYALQRKKTAPSFLSVILTHIPSPGELIKVPFHPAAIKKFLSYVYWGNLFASWFCKKYGNSIDTKNTIMYSYWFAVSAYGCVEIKNKLKKELLLISRAHRYDVFEELYPCNYLPFRTYLLDHIDKLFPVSRKNYDYFTGKYHAFKDKVEIAYLGVKKQPQQSHVYSEKIFHLLSCSLCSPVKRIHLIIRALHDITLCDEDNSDQNGVKQKLHQQQRKIKWTHIGDGTEKATLIQMAEQQLQGPGIEYSFVGQLTNDKVLSFYRENNVDCFITTSESEGLPVSIMEALSFSIPVIATDVGGIREIVTEKNGIILKADPNTREIAMAIRKIEGLNKNQITLLQHNAYYAWETIVNAEKNYPAFINRLKELFIAKT